MKIAFVYAAAITLAELITILVQPFAGIAIHIIILVSSVLYAGMATRLEAKLRQVILSLALVPLVRIISLSIPLVNIPQDWWYPVIYTPLAAGAFVMMRIPGYRLADVGLKFGFSRVQAAVSATGFIFGAAEYMILRPKPMAASLTIESVLPGAIIFLLFVGFVEELIFRGVLQKTAVDAFGARTGIIYVSYLFAILHAGFFSWIDVVFVFAVALLFAWVVNKTGSLWGVTLSHGITNSMLYLVMPLLFTR